MHLRTWHEFPKIPVCPDSKGAGEVPGRGRGGAREGQGGAWEGPGRGQEGARKGPGRGQEGAREGPDICGHGLKVSFPRSLSLQIPKGPGRGQEGLERARGCRGGVIHLRSWT